MAKKRAVNENRNSSELQYHHSGEERKVAEPSDYNQTAEANMRTHEDEENPFRDPDHVTAPNEHENPFNDENRTTAKYA